MKINENFVLRNVAESWVVIPLGQDMVNLNGIINLNESGAFLWEKLRSGAEVEELARVLTEEYEVSFEEAMADAEAFCKKLMDVGCLEK